MIVFATVLLVMALFLFYLYMFEWLRNRPSRIRRQRLAVVIGEKSSSEATLDKAVSNEPRINRLSLLEVSKKWLQEFELFKTRENGIAEFLRRAGIRLTPQEWLILCGILFVVPSALGLFLGRFGVGFAIGFLGLYSPIFYTRMRIKKRTKAFDGQLTDMLAIMSNSLKSGYSFLQSIQMIAGDMAAPISEEFDRMLREIRMGIPTEEALQSLNFRVNSQDFDLIVTAIIIQRQIGGNLAEILDNISDTIRERVRIQGEIKALTAQGRFSALIFMILPTAIGGLLTSINPGYVTQLFTNQLGWGMLGIGILGQVIGALIIRKIVRIEV